MKTQENLSYRSFLRERLTERMANNPRYSQRAFARDCGITPSMLTEVLQGKKNFTLETSHRVAANLGLKNLERDLFCLLVQFEGSKNEEQKANVQEQIAALLPRTNIYDLTLEHFKLLADWYHFPILQLTRIEGFDSKPESIAKRLGISTVEAQSALDRLERLGLVETDSETGQVRKTTGHVLFNAPTPNTALRRLYYQIHELSKATIETQTPKEKVIGVESIALNSSQIEEARAITEEYFQKMVNLSERAEGPTEVYQMLVNCFRISQPNPKSSGGKNEVVS